MSSASATSGAPLRREAAGGDGRLCLKVEAAGAGLTSGDASAYSTAA